MPRFFNNMVYDMNNNNNNNFIENHCPEKEKLMECGCKGECPTVYKECPPIVTCSKQTINQYHITKQPYIHNYVTEVVHHHILQKEFIPRYTCYDVHVNETNCDN